jgi:hypothetical protein
MADAVTDWRLIGLLLLALKPLSSYGWDGSPGVAPSSVEPGGFTNPMGEP